MSSTGSAFAPQEIAYVGDRVDNDVLPAHDAGMRRSLHPARPVGRAAGGMAGSRAGRRCEIDSLDELPEALRGL